MRELDELGERFWAWRACQQPRTRDDIPRLVDLYLRGRLNLDDLISARITLDEVNDGFRRLQEGAVARNVIKFEG